MATALEIDLLINAAQGANTLKDVRTTLKTINDEMIRVGKGTAEFDALAKAAANLEKRLEEVNNGINSMKPDTFETLTNFAGKAAGAVSLVSGAMALFGAESEDVQKALLKVQAAMAFAQGLESLKGIKSAYKDLAALIKATTIWQNVMNALEKQNIALKVAQTEATVGQAVATEGATIAQKALNVAMKANPLGLLIIAITALVAVFVTLNEIMGGASANTIKLNGELEKQKKITAALVAQYENEIIVLEAMGNQEAKIYDLKKQMMVQQLQELELSVEVHKSKLRDIKDNDTLYESLLKIGNVTGQNKLSDDLIATNKKERADEELKALEDEAAQIATLKAQLTALDINEEKRIADATQDKLDNEKEAADKKLADSKKSADDAARLREEQERLDKESDLRKLKNHHDYLEAKHAEEQRQHDLQKARFAKEQEDAAQNAEDWKAAIQEISEFADAANADEDARAKANKERDEMVMNARLETASSLFNSLSQLAEDNADLQKGFAVAEAIINTYKGVTAALAQPLPTPINFINAAVVFTAGIANVKKIMTVKPKVTTSAGGASLGGQPGSGGIAAINTAPAQPQQPTTQLDENGNVTGQNGQPNSIRVFVVESDITNTQNNVAVVQNAATHR